MKSGIYGFLIAISSSVLFVGTLHAASAYTIQAITLDNAQSISVSAIDNAEAISGTVEWNDGTESLVLLPFGEPAVVAGVLPGNTQILAEGLNSNGVIAGSFGQLASGFPTDYVFHSFIWNGSGPMQTLSAPDNFNSTALSLNDGGVAVGSISNQTTQEAVLWDAHGILANIGSYKYASKINNNGQIVVGDGVHEFLLSPGSDPVMVSDGTYLDVATTGLSDSGEVVGSFCDPATYDVHAFIAPSPGNLVDITPGSDLNSGATGVNSLDQVVGYLNNDNDPSYFAGSGFLYEDGEIFNLLTLAGDSGDGWSLLMPSSINDNGWIVGVGILNGAFQSFVMAPDTSGSIFSAPTTPEPATVGLLSFGLVGLMRRRKLGMLKMN